MVEVFYRESCTRTEAAAKLYNIRRLVVRHRMSERPTEVTKLEPLPWGPNGFVTPRLAAVPMDGSATLRLDGRIGRCTQ